LLAITTPYQRLSLVQKRRYVTTTPIFEQYRKIGKYRVILQQEVPNCFIENRLGHLAGESPCIIS
jgi:hypothetical protein